MSRPSLEKLFENYDGEIILADGLDSAFVGTVLVDGRTCAVYDSEKVIKALIEDGKSRRDAIEWFTYNVEDAYVGEGSPLFLTSKSEWRRELA